MLVYVGKINPAPINFFSFHISKNHQNSLPIIEQFVQDFWKCKFLKNMKIQHTLVETKYPCFQKIVFPQRYFAFTEQRSTSVWGLRFCYYGIYFTTRSLKCFSATSILKCCFPKKKVYSQNSKKDNDCSIDLLQETVKLSKTLQVWRG